MILFFDTETTGLVKFNVDETSEEQPRLVELAYLICEDDGTEVFSDVSIIKPFGFEIPTQASNVHSITTQKALSEGEDINEVFNEFTKHFDYITKLVAHNLRFDRAVVRSELKRFGSFFDHPIWTGKDYCTMLASTPICKLKATRGSGYKWPKLQEAYKFFFNKEFDKAHSALADVNACKEIYFKLQEYGKHRTNKDSIRSSESISTANC